MSRVIRSVFLSAVALVCLATSPLYPDPPRSAEKTGKTHSIKYNRQYAGYEKAEGEIRITKFDASGLVLTGFSFLDPGLSEGMAPMGEVLDEAYSSHFHRVLGERLSGKYSKKVRFIEHERSGERMNFSETYYQGVPFEAEIPNPSEGVALHFNRMVFDIDKKRSHCNHDPEGYLTVSFEFVLWDGRKGTFISFGRYSGETKFAGYLDRKELKLSAETVAKHFAKRLFY